MVVASKRKVYTVLATECKSLELKGQVFESTGGSIDDKQGRDSTVDK